MLHSELWELVMDTSDIFWPFLQKLKKEKKPQFHLSQDLQFFTYKSEIECYLSAKHLLHHIVS